MNFKKLELKIVRVIILMTIKFEDFDSEYFIGWKILGHFIQNFV